MTQPNPLLLRTGREHRAISNVVMARRKTARYVSFGRSCENGRVEVIACLLPRKN